MALRTSERFSLPHLTIFLALAKYPSGVLPSNFGGSNFMSRTIVNLHNCVKLQRKSGQRGFGVEESEIGCYHSQMRRLTPRQAAYRAYLKSDHWKVLRAEALKFYGRKCAHCPSTKKIQVHHTSYGSDWYAVTLVDLKPLCRRCHKIEHGQIPGGPKRMKRKKIKQILRRIRNMEKAWGIK